MGRTPPIFSVIVPIYKVENYLRQCIDSVLRQKDVAFEVILVDDGSPDACPQICDEYAQKDDRIKVVHKHNGGLSSARNAGIELASGKYILFLDSDDYYDDENALSKLQVACEKNNADYIGFNCKNYNVSTDEIKIEDCGMDGESMLNFSGMDIVTYFTQVGKFPGAAWVAAIKNDFIVRHKIRFTEGIKSEDIDWLMYIFINAEKYDFINLSFYVYRLNRGNSITNSINIKSVQDMLYITRKWSQEIAKNEFADHRLYLNDFLAYHYLSTLILYRYLKTSDKQIAKTTILAQKHMLNVGCVRKKVKIAAWIFRLLGLEFGSYILFIYHRYIRNK